MKGLSRRKRLIRVGGRAFHRAVRRTPTRGREISRLPSISILRQSARMSDYRFFDRLRAGDTLARALARMAPEFPELEVTGIVADFTRGLDLRNDLGDAPALFFYPGSSIGNFQPDDARRFLSDVHLHCIASERGGLLIGVDTKKESRRLTAAYDDSLGVTAAFNR